MFDKSLSFLEKLKSNNNREWFVDNKTMYEEAKKEFEGTVELLIHEIGKFDQNIAPLTPKDCVFRIFRDVRFSKDKSPYKTNFGAFMAKGGKKSGYAGYYIHIDPDDPFLAGGIHMPPNHVLKEIRNDIIENIEEFKNIIYDENFVNIFGEVKGEKLKTAPKGIEKDHKYIELLKYKSYTVIKPIEKEDIYKSDFFEGIIADFRNTMTFNNFLNLSISKYLSKNPTRKL